MVTTNNNNNLHNHHYYCHSYSCCCSSYFNVSLTRSMKLSFHNILSSQCTKFTVTVISKYASKPAMCTNGSMEGLHAEPVARMGFVKSLCSIFNRYSAKWLEKCQLWELSLQNLMGGGGGGGRKTQKKIPPTQGQKNAQHSFNFK
jgi:hypothetical protein